ncbi:GNAT family N-acetyltransferase [Usitatibacter palustris]|uniref:Acetyltransferase n=1 Tax=Usitatibacter palustris TaxID=2732487 RepID=A0A6M4H426_9PROT|nr:GNAT family N-acetyltransferase [Usitatibacter palustris]QJR14085.1 Acetyltransferase [Usitatibacter palustris]
MATPTPFAVRIVEWTESGPLLDRVRTIVFVDEQKVPREIESDGRDGKCVHVLAESEGEAIGAGRLMADGRIGRMAVLAAWRGRGVGGAMLTALMQEARRRGMRETYLHSQSHAKDFYVRHGYVVEGEEYYEAGIAHIGMRAKL